jgi:putative tricarboxylic transport membrane protein
MAYRFDGAHCAAVVLAFLSAVGSAYLHAASAPWAPTRPVEIVVSSGPGSGLDITARFLEKIIRERRLIQTPWVVMNKPGAGSAIAYSYLSRFEGDGAYLGLMSNSLLMSHIEGKSQNSHTDFTSIAVLFSEYIALMVRADSPIANARDFMDRLRKDPTSLTIGVAAALGGPNHTAFASALRTAGVSPMKVRTVVFKGSGESITALLGGHVDAVPATVASAQPQFKNGAVRVIAISAPRRLSGLFATVPTWKESGYDSVFSNWRGINAPKGLTAAQIAYWDQVFGAVTSTEEWKRDVEENHRDNIYLDSRATKAYLDTQYTELKAVLGDLGLAAR